MTLAAVLGLGMLSLVLYVWLMDLKQDLGSSLAQSAAASTSSAIKIIETREALSVKLTSTAATPTAAALLARAAYSEERAKAEVDGQRMGVNLLGALAIGVILISAVTAYLIYSRANRTDTSNGPVYKAGRGTFVRTGKMLGGAISVVSPTWLDELNRLFTWIATKQLPPPAQDRVVTYDGGATAEHYVAAARADSGANALAHAMTSRLSEQERLDRMKAMRGNFQAAAAAALPSGVSGSLPTPDVVNGPEGVQVRQVLGRLGLQAPAQWQVDQPANASPQALPQGTADSDILDLSELQGVIVGE